VIAVDAMGGDYAPRAAVTGALKAAQKGIPLILFGNERQIVHILDQTYSQWRKLPITIDHCSEVITMEENPIASVRSKLDSSLVLACKAVADGRADAVISAGNSGAALVAGSLFLGKIPGVIRPAIGDFLPTPSGTIFCVDLGANVDCKPEHLLSFAFMGHAYVQVANGIERPRIALLSNGAERAKGTKLVKEAYLLLEQSDINFIGNLEPRDMFTGVADVLVCDGFAGNIMLKAIEGTVTTLIEWQKKAYMRNWATKLTGLFHQFLMRGLKKKVDYAQKGGALLLGVQHPCIIAHGCSDTRAFFNAIEYAHRVASSKTYYQFTQVVEDLMRRERKHGSMFHGMGSQSEVAL
jgi:glycerol-3-phosphate acyltransferase PlsX